MKSVATAPLEIYYTFRVSVVQIRTTERAKTLNIAVSAPPCINTPENMLKFV